MNILLIGNGFDLAHHLPTTYKDFLNFLERIHPKNVVHHKQLNDSIEELISNAINKAVLERMRNLYINNLWYHYFLQRNNISPNWCDFENEIEYITNELQVTKKFLSKKRREASGRLPFTEKPFLKIAISAFYFDVWQRKKDTLTFHMPYSELNEMPQTAFLTYGTNYTDNDLAYKIQNKSSGTIAFEHLLNFIIKQLNDFTKCFELYLTIFVKKLNIPKIKFIDDILKTPNINIISFNYTNTISKYITISDNNISFIHGKATDNEHNNLVLGIDEKENQTDPQFMRFKKYFQRYEKGCDNKYYKWIKEITYQNTAYRITPTHNLLIIGHSLTLSDREILYKLITINEMKTSIYYHSEESKIELMQNLAAILGQENFTNLTQNEKICFIPSAFNEIEN